MTSFSITNALGNIIVNGIPLDEGAGRGVVTPAEITGDGEFYLACNADAGVTVRDTDPDTLEETVRYIPAAPVSITISDALGVITTVDSDTRFPYEGNFPLLRPVRVV